MLTETTLVISIEGYSPSYKVQHSHPTSAALQPQLVQELGLTDSRTASHSFSLC